MVEKRKAYRVLVGKPEGKKPLRRYRSRWEDNIKMDHQEVGRRGGGVNWTDLAQDKERSMAVVKSEKQIRVSIKCGGYNLAKEVLCFQWGPYCSWLVRYLVNQ